MMTAMRVPAAKNWAILSRRYVQVLLGERISAMKSGPNSGQTLS